VTSKHLPFSFSIFALVFVASCAGFRAGQEVQSGRAALQRDEPAVAIGYFRRAADLDPNYVTPFSGGGSVWTYLGRAYYEAGNYSEARQLLEKTLSSDKDNPMAQLYLGLSILRSGDSDKGSRQIQNALKGIYDWLNRAASRPGNGIYWDPAREIRSQIQKTLTEKPEPAKLISVAEWVGMRVDEEPDRVRRDEARDKYESGKSD
jgi:tetratricopeptide (TPR) repeat protein